MKYCGRADHRETHLFRDADGDHVPLDELAKLYAGVVLAGYKIDRIIRRSDFKDDFRIGAS